MMLRILAVVVAILLAAPVRAQQQQPPPPPPPDTDYAPPPPAAQPPRIPATGFVMPDLPDDTKKYTSYDGRAFSTAFNFVSLVDYNAFTQDANSTTQVGEQKDQWDLRTVRLMVRGTMKFRHPVSYFVSVEIKGKDHVQNEDSKLGFTDVELSTDLGKLGVFRFGKIKEPFVYEMVGDAANLSQQERALNPFFVSRGIGAKLAKPFAHDSMTWSVGWFNDWWVEGEGFNHSGNEFAARFTGIPVFTDGGATYLHLGIGARYVGDENGTLQFKGRPESNVTSNYVDSGTLTGDHARELSLESLWGHGPFLLSGEYARAWVDADASGDPRFWGGSIVVGYVLTGEHRPYDKKVAYARRILPQHRIGAFEVVGRVSHVDIDDALVRGGIFDRATIGLNWWATRRWKFGIDYGSIGLDRKDLSGHTNAVHTRIQWVY